MTPDEYNKALVDAAIKFGKNYANIPDEDPLDEEIYPWLEGLLTAIDAVPRPSEEEMVEALARKWCSMDGKNWKEREDGYLADAAELITALRPWLKGEA